MTLNGGTAPIYSDPNMGSPWGILVPSSLNMMRGCEGRQEGIYASSDQSRSGRPPLQNDLGLTLLPGSQIQHADERPHQVANSGGRALRQTPNLVGDSEVSSQAGDFLFSEGKGSENRKGNASSDMGQTLIWIEERRASLAEKELQALNWNERRPFYDPLQYVAEGRSRYCLRVRGSKYAPQDDGGDRSHKRRKPEMTALTNLETNKPVDARGLPPGNGAAHSTGNSATQPPAPAYQQNVPPLVPILTQKPSSNTLTSHYPKCSKRSFPVHEPNTSQNLSLPILYNNGTEESVMDYDVMNVSRDYAYKQMQAELSQTKLELSTKTRAVSDAQQIINDLRKTANDLHISADTYTELQKAHKNLFEEFRQVLNLYKSLAHKHSACRGSSSKKLAQRIIASKSPSNDSAYASRSSSVAAPLTFSPSTEVETAIDYSHLGHPLVDTTTMKTSALPAAATLSPNLAHGNFTPEQLEPPADQSNTNTEYSDLNHAGRLSLTAVLPTPVESREATVVNGCLDVRGPLIDLTATDTPAPLPTATASMPDLTHGNSTAEQQEPTADQSSSHTEHDDPNYANINGFDEEANDLFDALWEQEMVSWDAEQVAETGA